MKDAEKDSFKQGKLLIAFSDEKNGSTVGVEYLSMGSTQANFLMGICSVAASDNEKRIVTSSALGDTGSNQITTHDGGDNLEKRLAVLEAEVAHIKSDISDIKKDQRTIASDAASSSSDIKVVLQKLIDIDTNLSTKAGKDYVESAVSGMKVWLLGILLISIAMPVITFLINLYLKKP